MRLQSRVRPAAATFHIQRFQRKQVWFSAPARVAAVRQAGAALCCANISHIECRIVYFDSWL